MVITRGGLPALALSSLVAGIFACAAVPTSASAQSKNQLRAQFAKTTTKLAEMAWNSTCSADIVSLCSQTKRGDGRLYNCLVRNKAKLTEGCIKTLPKAKPLVDQLAQIRAKLAPTKKPKYSVKIPEAVKALDKDDSWYTFKHGFPANAETIKKAQDATDLRRAIEAYKFFFPTVATEAVIQQFKPHGAIPNKVGIIMPQDPEQQFSVSNQDTPYIIAVLDFRKSGPMVIDIPEGPYIGLLCDHNMDPVADMGTIGAGKGKGEKNLILPPGYDGKIPEGYHAYQSETWEAVAAVRIMSKTGSYDEAVDLAQKVKVYPLSEAGKPSTFRIVDVKGQKAPLPMLSWETSMDYWRELHAVVDRETAQMRHRVMLGMLALKKEKTLSQLSARRLFSRKPLK